MKKKNLTRIAVIFLVGTLLAAYGMISAAAKESNVTYEGGSKQVITLPSDDLFPDFKGIMPGAVTAQSIKVTNNSNDRISLYLKAVNAEDGNNALLAQLQLILTKTADGSSEVVYSGPLSGVTTGQSGETAPMTEFISLGTYAKNTQADLVATLMVPGSIGNAYQNAAAKIKWVFYAGGPDPISIPDESTPYKPPVSIPDESVPLNPPSSPSNNDSSRTVIPIDDEDVPMSGTPLTGDTTNLIWIVALAVVSAGAVVVVLKNKKTDK